MSASRKGTGSDLAKVDSHEITLDEYDEIPELTDEFFARATLHVNGVPAKKRGRPKLESPKQSISIRLDAEVIDSLKATGSGWQTRANAILRRHFRQHTGNTKKKAS